MRIELLFHVFFLYEVLFDQDCQKKSDRLIATGQRQRGNGSRAARQFEYRCLWPC